MRYLFLLMNFVTEVEIENDFLILFSSRRKCKNFYLFQEKKAGVIFPESYGQGHVIPVMVTQNANISKIPRSPKRAWSLVPRSRSNSMSVVKVTKNADISKSHTVNPKYGSWPKPPFPILLMSCISV